MAKINFDTSKKLDITCRRGDTFKLELTLKDSSGIPINLHGADGEDEFQMLVRTARGNSPSRIIAATRGLVEYANAEAEILADNKDLSTSTTADTTDSSYDASTAASGKVTFTMSAASLNLDNIPGGSISCVYDIHRIDKSTTFTVPGSEESEGKTILYGSFFIKDDLSILY